MRKKLLVVDDEQNVLTFCARVLGRAGYEVHCAHCGEAALTLLQNERYALLATDIRMPGMSGIELIRHARALEPGMAAIAFTGSSGSEIASQALRAGAHVFMPKPFKAAELIHAVESALAGSAANADPHADESADPTLPRSFGPNLTPRADAQ